MVCSSLGAAPCLVVGPPCDLVDLNVQSFLKQDRTFTVVYRDSKIWCDDTGQRTDMFSQPRGLSMLFPTNNMWE